MSAIADAVCPGGVAAQVAVAPDAHPCTPRVNTARTAPTTRTCRLPRTPRLLRIIPAPLVGLDATGLVAAHRASRSGGGWAREVFHRHRHAGSSSAATDRKSCADPARQGQSDLTVHDARPHGPVGSAPLRSAWVVAAEMCKVPCSFCHISFLTCCGTKCHNITHSMLFLVITSLIWDDWNTAHIAR